MNTLPPETFAAYRDHGNPEVRIHEGMAAAPEQLKALAAAGIDLAGVTRELEDDGVAKFAASYSGVLAAIETKAGALAGPRAAGSRGAPLAHLVDLHRDGVRHPARRASRPGSPPSSSRSAPSS